MAKITFGQATQLADQIKQTRKAVLDIYDQTDAIFFMSDASMPKGDHVKPTMSPDGRNKVLGASRLLSSSDPQWSVPFDSNDLDAKTKSSNLERLAAACWSGAGRIRGRAIHYELAKDAFRYDEAHIAIYTSADAIAAGGKADANRVADAASFTPLMFEAINPRLCYPIFDQYGLAAHLTIRKMMVKDVIARWGKTAEKLLASRANKFDIVTYNELWDMENHAVWLNELGEFIYANVNPWPFIPISASAIEGSDDEDQTKGQDTRQPFLYTMHKSGLWKRQNLALTAMYTWAYVMGVPKIVYAANSPDKKLDLDLGEVVINIESGESVTALNKNAIDQSLTEAWNLSKDLVEQSTMYSQTLGEPLGGNAPYSMVSLMSQAGRLPLVVYQRVLSGLIGDAMRKGLKMLKLQNADINILGAGKQGEALVLKGKDIPDRVDIRANLDISLPQDERLSVQTAQQATAGDNPLMPMRMARERYLNIGQSDDATKEIWAEKLAQVQLQMAFQQQMQALQAQQGQQGQSGQPQPGQQPPQGQPGQQGIPPEVLAQMQQQAQAQQGGPQAAGNGLPLSEPVNPQGQPNPNTPPGGPNVP